MKIEKALIIESKKTHKNKLLDFLRSKNLQVISTEKVNQAFIFAKECPFDLVLCSSYNAVLFDELKSQNPEILIIALGKGQIKDSFATWHEQDDLSSRWRELFSHIVKKEEDRYLHCPIAKKSASQIDQIITESSVMKEIMHDVKKVARTKASVFISGESGTGKEVVACALHLLSKRANKPFIKVNCAAVPETLIEAEFFGHEKGAFTGAMGRRIGRFELADQGTLLLDEVTEIPFGLQAKLLRAIQEKEIERLGSNQPVSVDVRLIATSNRNLEQAICEKSFREDLYYRLNVVPLYLPPLRERKEDILPLAEFFLKRLCQENEIHLKKFSSEAHEKLLDYSWPGNIRELGNVLERCVVTLDEEIILPESLILTEKSVADSIPLPSGISLEELEKRMILQTLAQCNNNRSQAAELLGINVRTLRNKLFLYREV